MRQITRLSIAILCLLLLSSACVFADGFNFKLFHRIGTQGAINFMFWNPSTNGLYASNKVNFEEGGTYDFVTVVAQYNSDTTVTSLTLEFSPLLDSSTNNYYKYDINFFKPNTKTALFSTMSFSLTDTTPKTQVLFSGGKTFEKEAGKVWTTDELVDLQMVLYDEESAAGSYVGNIKFTIVGGS